MIVKSEFSIHESNIYTLYYDESNNIRSLLLCGEEYNIDNDPNQKSSPIFILAGIGHSEINKNLNFDSLLEKLSLQKSSEELKFSQMVKIKAKYSPSESFKYALGSKRFKSLFEWLLSNNVFIHYQMINTVYWSFIDVIDDIVMSIEENNNDIQLHHYYKDCLYLLIKSDKQLFLSLMTKFDYPKIEKSNSIQFLEGLRSLLKSHIKNESNKLNLKMLSDFEALINKCLNKYKKNLDFQFVFDSKINTLISDFSIFYVNRIKTFPQSKHILDEELDVQEKINTILPVDKELKEIYFKFVDSKLPINISIQVSDVMSGFLRLYFSFLESSSIYEVESFCENLNITQTKTIVLFKKLVDYSCAESPLLLNRVIVPIDEHKAMLLFEEVKNITKKSSRQDKSRTLEPTERS